MSDLDLEPEEAAAVADQMRSTHESLRAAAESVDDLDEPATTFDPEW